MIKKEDGFILSTGKEIYANNEMLGLAFNDDGDEFDGWHIGEGADGGICYEDLTAGEQHEIADFMIGLWGKFKRDIKA